MAFLSEETISIVKYTFTVPLHGRHRPEFGIDINQLESYSPHKKDNPLLELLALRLRGEGLTNVTIRVRLYLASFEVDQKIPTELQLSVCQTINKIKQVVEELCTIGQRHEPVYARVTNI